MDKTKYKTEIHTVDEPFTSISINTATADIVFEKSESDICEVVCFESEKVGYKVSVKNNTLNIDINDTRRWYDYISLFSFSNPKITLRLSQDNYASLLIKSSTGDIKIPKDFAFNNVDIKASTGNVDCKASAVDDLKIKLSTGQINVENTSAGNITLTTYTGQINAKSVECSSKIEANVSTGKTNFINIKCNNLISNGSTGDINLKNVDAGKKFTITRSTGDVNFDGCDADELFITTDTGDVSGTLLTDKVFICKTDTGDIDVPKTTTGGKCEITTDTGDIQINVGK